MKDKFLYGTAILAFLASCSTPSTVNLVEEKQQMINNISAKSANEHYAVCYWFSKVYQDPNLKPEQKSKASRALSKAEAAVIAGITQTINGELSVALLGDTAGLTSQEGTDEDLMILYREYHKDIPVKINVKRAESLAWIQGLPKSNFGSWAKGNPLTINLSKKNPSVSSELDEKINNRIDSRLIDAENLLSQSKLPEAFALVNELQQNFSDSPFEDKVKPGFDKIAFNYIQQTIRIAAAMDFSIQENIDLANQSLIELEKSVSVSPALAAVFTKDLKDQYMAVREKIAESRLIKITNEFEELKAKNYYWTLYQLHQEKLVEIETAHPLEKPVLIAGVWSYYRAILPDAIEFLVLQAQENIEQGERHGSAVIIYRMCDEMIAYLVVSDTSQTDQFKGQLRELSILKKESQKFIKQFLSRSLVINDIDPKQGLGTELKNELEGDFAEIFENHPLLYGLKMKEGEGTREDYVIAKGIYPNLDASYGPPQRSQKLEILKGKVTKHTNQDWQNARKSQRANIPQFVYKQKLYRYTVTSESIEAVANARLSFKVNFQDKSTNVRINLGQSLKREFINESIDPNFTKVEEQKLSVMPKESFPENPQPELKKERILSLLEMKEWARKETRYLAKLKIMNVLVAYPTVLQAQSEDYVNAQNWKVASNFTGILMDYMEHINTEGDIEFFTNAEQAEYHKEAFDANLKTLEQLKVFKKVVPEQAIEQLVNYLEN
ncbi:MAG: hypothetical protein MK193_03785 [Lentisphaeria bacterium]|nr:hypothetical protein [Lentisphaeria bacterium]